MPNMTLSADLESNRNSTLSPARVGMTARVLVVSYNFPPVGGAGVQRVTKLVKYLGRLRWQPTVLTVANPSVPVFDHSLERDIPPEIEICRARSWEPDYRLKARIGAASNSSAVSKSSGLTKSINHLLRGLA